MIKVLFVCVHNSGRSQMAEAFFNQGARGKARAYSAGTRPASHTDRTVVEAMREVGIDVTSQHPKLLTREMIENAHKIINMGCGTQDSCPVVLVPSEAWQLEDPEGQPIEQVRRIRDGIQARVRELIAAIEQEEIRNAQTKIS
jgi:arsenate reductase (thioredoxin)